MPDSRVDVVTSGPRPGSPDRGNGSRVALWAYRLLPLALLPALLVLSRDFGITWDEKTHQMYGEAVWEFVTTRADSHWFHPDWYMYLHGGLFDGLCAAAQRLVPGDPWSTRHYVNALFGWLGIVFVGRMGRLLGGPGTGLLAMALLTLSPRYLADAMNNPKDVPFAALSAVAVYYLLRLRPRFPFVGVREFVALVVAMALALDVRAGAVLLLAYLAIALFGLTLATRDLAPRQLATTAATYVALVLCVLVAGTAFWPWAQVQPLKRPLQAVSLLSSFDWGYTVLFRGRDFPANALPLDYVPTWAALTTPPVVLAGALLSVLLLRSAGATRWRVAGLWFAALFPPAFVALRHATIYDGIRHLLFAYPPLVAVAAAGWTTLLALPRHTPLPAREHSPLPARGQTLRFAAAGLLAAGLAEPLVFDLRNHPNECVYFNAFAGGPRGALGVYELDYWANSTHQAVAWVEAAARGTGARLVLSGHPPHVVRDEARRLPGLDFARSELKRQQLDVLVLRGPRQEVLELAARRDALHRVTTADGTPLAIVVPGPAFAEITDLPAFAAGASSVLR